MTATVSLLNSVLTAAFQFILFACDSVYPYLGLWTVSILSGIVLAYFYGKLSNQGSIRRTKDAIYASLLEVVLFRRHLPIALRAQGKMLLFACRYLGLAVPPVLALSVPCILVMAQLYLQYGHAPLPPGARAIVTVKTIDEKSLPQVSVVAPSGLVLETDALHVPQEKKIFWRIRALEAKLYDLTFTAGPEAPAVPVTIAAMKSTEHPVAEYTSDWWWALLYPGGGILPREGGLSNISVSYPELPLPFLGFNSSWIVIFLVISIVSAFIFSKVSGVEL